MKKSAMLAMSMAILASSAGHIPIEARSPMPARTKPPEKQPKGNKYIFYHNGERHEIYAMNKKNADRKWSNKLKTLE